MGVGGWVGGGGGVAHPNIPVSFRSGFKRTLFLTLYLGLGVDPLPIAFTW